MMGKCHYDSAWLSKTDSNGDIIKTWAEKAKETGMLFCRACGKPFAHRNGLHSIQQHAATAGHKTRMNDRRVSGLRQLNLAGEPEPVSSVSWASSSSSPTSAPGTSTSRPSATVQGEDVSVDADDPQSLEEIAAASKGDKEPTTSHPCTLAHVAHPPHGKNSRPVQQTLRLYDSKQSASRAELIWVMKCVHSNYSFASCENAEKVFRRMFPTEHAVPDKFSCKPTKVAYLLTEALAPWCLQNLVNDVGDSCFTILYDETTNNASRKELDVGIRYWSHSQGKIHTQHLKSYFIGKATAEILKGKLDEAMDTTGLVRRNLLSLGSDGPNVNKSVWRKMNEDMIRERAVGLIDIGSCNIHILHTAFERGLDQLGDGASDFITNVHDFFDGWPSRWEEYEAVQSKLQIPAHRIMKHVSSRWLSLEPAAERALEQLPALKEYFLKQLPRKNTALATKPAASKIRDALKNPFLEAELHFIMSSARLFTKFTGFFQRDEPLVHLLYSEMVALVKKLVGRACKPSAFEKVGLSTDIFNAEYLLKVENVDVGEKAKNELKKLSDLGHPPADIQKFRFQAQKHVQAACSHILQKSALKNKAIVRALRCLHPEERKNVRSKTHICDIAKQVPFPVDCDALRDEWTLLNTEPESSFPSNSSLPVSEYWGAVFNIQTPASMPKFPLISKVLKAALCLSHGNAFVEREFSTSNLFLTDDKARMKERTLDAAMTVKSSLRLYGGPENFPIDDMMLKMARTAYLSYENYLEGERQKAKDEQQRREQAESARKAAEELKKQTDREKKNIQEAEVQMKNLRTVVKEKKELFSTLQSDANKRLKKATENKNLNEVSASQAMFDAAERVREEMEVKVKELDSLQRSVDKRKSQMIGNLSAKKTRLDL